MNAVWKRLAGLVLALAVGFSADVPAQEGRTFSPQELDRLLAPVALYPDALLSQLLMASTYPLEVVQAVRWTQANPGLRGEALDQALAEQDWDPSVKALVPFPQVLEMMSERLDWTQRLGDAVLAQQDQVMATVQQLRRKAQEAGNLATTRQQTVVVEPDVIVIEPADPEVVYVPVYNPTVVYGRWWWPAPPYAWYPRSYVVGSSVVAGVTFGLGVAVGHYLWGGFDWHHRRIHVHRDVDVVRNVSVNRNINLRRDRAARERVPYWEHDPSHRRGVRYRDYATRERFGVASGERPREPASRERFASRPDGRGRAGDVGSPRLRERPPATAAGGPPEDGRTRADRRPAPGAEHGLAGEYARRERPAADPDRFDLRRDALRQRLRDLQSPSLRAGRGESREPPSPSSRAGRKEVREPPTPSSRAARREVREPLSPAIRAGRVEPRELLSPALRAGQEPRRAGGARSRTAEPTSTPMLPFARDDSGRGRQSVAPQARGRADGGGRPGPGARREGWQPSRGADRGAGRDLARAQSGR